MPTSVTVTLKISVEIDDEYAASDHVENIFEVTQKTFPIASVEMLEPNLPGDTDCEPL